MENVAPHIMLLLEEGTLTVEQIETAAEKARKKQVTAERMLVLLGYLNRTQLIDAIDKTLHRDDGALDDTASGVMELRKEIQTLTGVARIARDTGTGDALKQYK